MRTIWIIVADFTKASFYTFSKAAPEFALIKCLSCPESRLKERDLKTDKPGHYTKDHVHKGNLQKGAYAIPHTAKLGVMEEFVKEICDEMETARIAHHCDGFVIFADPQLYGMIQKCASKQVQRLVQLHKNKHYTQLPEKELKATLHAQLKPLLRSFVLAPLTG